MTKLVPLPAGGPGADYNWFAASALFDEVADFGLRHVTDGRSVISRPTPRRATCSSQSCPSPTGRMS
ncbi:hypothetical protein AB0D38_08775 [Streptomyces sp. NPDC048279]|uniref:hypothetical protein n=1 Tax=Streptomyces sp. NPDC048279 TaxID=3154714 RepID=UPI003426F7AE